MNIIIIGCGKVGQTLAAMLVKEKHSVTMIDVSAERLAGLNDDVDAIRMQGNGASISIQREAGIETADILIAVTGSDELNLLCCVIAKRAGSAQTIARVRNPVYNDELNFIKEQMGISMIMNPELDAAREISDVLRFPSAIEIEQFAGRRVELLKFKLLPEFNLDGVTVRDMDVRLKANVLIAGVERGDEVTIPDGKFVLRNGDAITILATPAASEQFFKSIGMKTNQVKNTLVIGGGTIAQYLADILAGMHIDAKIIEKDRERCDYLVEHLPKATIIHGDGTDRGLLDRVGLMGAQSVVALTNVDEENVILSLYVKEHSKAKPVTKINRLEFYGMLNKMDLGSVIYPKYITADHILQYVRALGNSIGSNVERLYHIMNNKAEALEFAVKEDSAVTGKPLMELGKNLKKNLLIGCIVRQGQIMIPKGQDMIMKGDTVVVVTTQEELGDIRDILR
ncbi:MAG: Trk system potassium transporter TrkA [Lachnospiraceae bacterium]|nr:Trk system potassium transporter TrkA [Lachnospiraceae bacterium]